MGRSIEVQETINKKFTFAKQLCAPLKVSQMARAMPAIP